MKDRKTLDSKITILKKVIAENTCLNTNELVCNKCFIREYNRGNCRHLSSLCKELLKKLIEQQDSKIDFL